MTPFAMVFTTLPADHDTDSLARTLVEERLAACVNVLGTMKSVYRWKGAVEAAAERQIIIKTTRANVTDLQRRLQELHPYELPEFLVVGVEEGSEPYLAWLASAVR